MPVGLRELADEGKGREIGERGAAAEKIGPMGKTAFQREQVIGSGRAMFQRIDVIVTVRVFVAVEVQLEIAVALRDEVQHVV